MIEVSGAAFLGGMAPGALPGARFVANASAAATAPAGTSQFVFNTSNGVLYWDADGAGGQGPQAIAWLVGGTTLSAADLVVV